MNIRIAANFTAEPIEPFMAYWMSQLAIPVEIRFAPYNQVFQQLLEGGLLRSNRGGVNLVALDLDAWLVAGPLAEARTQLERTLADLTAAMRAAGALGAGGALLLFPSNPHETAERLAVVAEAKAALLAACSSLPAWSAVDLVDAVALYGISKTHDRFTNELGNIPFTEEMYAAAATAAARWIRAARTKARKVIALDCDNTLWQGICGEGPVQFTEPYRKLHEFMLRQQENGVLLALVSKNNEPDVMSVLETEDCLLRSEHLTAWRINWQPKSENLRALSEELGLALNTFLFLDDSSYECMEVRNQCPEVLTIQLPADPAAIPAFLDHLWAFDRPAATDEDRSRTKMYQAERQRAELSRRSMTPEEFLASLRLEIQIAPAAESDLARVAQLTHRTTQFNMTGVLHSQQSLSALLAQGRYACRTVRVRDTFGDYGLVGALLFQTVNGVLRVENFLLSCRALGRRVEDRMVEHLRSGAAEQGVERLLIPVVPTARNRPALEFLNRVCGAPVEAQEPFECILSVNGDSSEWQPATIAAAAEATAQALSPSPAATDEEGTLVWIASELRTASALISKIRTPTKQRPGSAAPLVAPRNALEASLARIWSECLGVEPMGVKDDFFDFGGSSLIAARVLARTRTAFGVELNLTTFFDAPTVEGHAIQVAEAMTAQASAVTV